MEEFKDYQPDELYAPVMEKCSFRCLVCVACAHHAFLHTMDVTTAFLYGHISEEIYCTPPKGVVIDFGYVWRLLKSLYGTRQVPAIWHKVIADWFV